MTIRHYSFECADLKPNPEPKTVHTDLDKVYGDIVFQELGLEGKPRGGMMMTVKKRKLPFAKGTASSILATIPEPRYHLARASAVFRAEVLQAQVDAVDPPLRAV
ncbi:hypothetical protein NM208_g16900 [Fusarium decemcellulare]|uniref:Uncharacterized protein n=1 Tax=Fusarium decemcellulare TaxID=57161 RepID=A0ACC1RAM5_9HYPO|nr:hypothetical protein NM208_g16900 [Fusarium decemcellulare]